MKTSRYLISVLLIVLYCCTFNAAAQRSVILNQVNYDAQAKFHFGFVLGGNETYVSIRPIADLATHVFDSTYIPDILPLPEHARILSIESSPTPGFVISIIANMHMGDNFDLRFIPSLSFGDRDLIYKIETYRKGDTTLMSVTKRVPSTYVNFPIEIKYKSKRYNNFRAYIMGGAQYTLDLASQAKKREQKSADQKIVKFNASDIYAEGGVGFDFYNEWFKFGIELKMMYGLMDVLRHENNIYTDGIASLKSKIFQVSFTFE